MRTVQIRHLAVGEGIPKICVPIVGRSREDIDLAVKRIVSNPVQPDMIEFRADWYEKIFEDGIENILLSMREKIGDIPLLFTFRTAREGGEREIGWEQYRMLLLQAAKSDQIDAVDVEAFSFVNEEEQISQEDIKRLMMQLHEEHMVVVGSNHDFEKTPPKEELVRRLHKMRDMKTDIAKIAVMPLDMKDVLTLLGATYEAREDENMCPVITMSMSSKGVISRMAGELFGSAVTFASLGTASAPGQIEIEQLQVVLNILYHC